MKRIVVLLTTFLIVALQGCGGGGGSAGGGEVSTDGGGDDGDGGGDDGDGGDDGVIQYATGSSGFGDKVISVTKSGADPLTLIDSDTVSLTGIYDDEQVFIRDGVDLEPPDLIAVPADNSSTPIRFENTVAAEFSRARSHPVFRYTPAGTAFVLEGVGALSNAGGAMLKTVDPGNPGETLALGQVPAEVERLFPGEGLGRYHLAQASWVVVNGTSVTPTSDIFFLDTETPDSLLRITDTPDVSEFPVR